MREMYSLIICIALAPFAERAGLGGRDLGFRVC